MCKKDLVQVVLHYTLHIYIYIILTRYQVLAELRGNLLSRHACPLERAVFCCEG